MKTNCNEGLRMQNLISITIPTYNGSKYIRECIESIYAQGINTEIIVIDDISTDNTVEIAKQMGVKVIVNDVHKGQVAGKNTGIRESSGCYWLTIDQDDKLVEGALEYLLKEFDKEPDTKIVMAQFKDFCSPDTPDQKRFCNPNPRRGILTGTTMFKKEIFDIVGFFREDLITGDVIDLTTRLAQHNIGIKKVDMVTCARRIHDLNYGRTNQADEYKDYAKLLRQRLSKNNK